MSSGKFKKDLEELINKHCLENGSNTPDYILAEYMCHCLHCFERAVNLRDKHKGLVEQNQTEMPL
jgi:hypothetical protein